ncbi:hypothetical protein ABZ517_05685 [Streptomyces scabiei]|uniref:hypothetical protein n=1 Tax=Streptomyces scabiei TaxID=1930 RepID=UPI0033E7ED05
MVGLGTGRPSGRKGRSSNAVGFDQGWKLKRITLESGLEVEVLGRCTRSFCRNTATLAVTLLLHDGGRDKHTYGKCQKHVDAEYLSAEEYAKRTAAHGGSTLDLYVHEREKYEIRDLTEQEAAEVAYEAKAPERWEAEGRMGAFRRIVALHQCEKIDGILVDATSAQLVVAVHDALNEKNRAKYGQMPVGVMVDFALRHTN